MTGLTNSTPSPRVAMSQPESVWVSPSKAVFMRKASQFAAVGLLGLIAGSAGSEIAPLATTALELAAAHERATNAEARAGQAAAEVARAHAAEAAARTALTTDFAAQEVALAVRAVALIEREVSISAVEAAAEIDRNGGTFVDGCHKPHLTP